jgi:hypothetical protein
MGGMSSTVTAEQVAAVRTLWGALPSGAYLAGGVAIAATLHHRVSRDLDVFLPEDFDPARLAEELTARVAGFVVTGTGRGALYAEVAGVPTSLITYRYPMLSAPQRDPELGIEVASLEDLACMKLSAIASRGLARDFWDLHALLDHGVAGGSLQEALRLYQRKYTTDDIGHVVRSLAYFGDAESAPLPLGLSPSDWQRMRSDFERWVPDLG